MFKHILYAITSLALLTGATAQAQDKPILNASYDVAREVFAAINPKFQAQWKAQTGKELQIDQSSVQTQPIEYATNNQTTLNFSWFQVVQSYLKHALTDNYGLV